MKKTVLITGASRGIGRATAEKFASKGYNIVLCYNSSEKEAKELAEKLCKKVGVLLAKVDVSKTAEIDKLYEDAERVFGRIDVVVNNAGIADYKLIIDEDFESINKMIQTNLVSIMYSSKKAVEHMMKFDGGKIVNISSIYASKGESFETVYSATKSALTGFTCGLAKEVGSAGILVNNVAPGCIKTGINKEFFKDESAVKDFFSGAAIKRPGEPEEVAELIYFLASSANTYITGQTIYIDGCL